MEEVGNYLYILENIKEHIPEWKDITYEQLEIKKMPFGLSRQAYAVKITDSCKDTVIPKSFIYREFKYSSDQGKEMKDKENRVFQKLSEMKISPHLYGGNDKYRIEEYIESRPIKSYEINDKDLRRKLAIKLGFIHRVEMDLDSSSFIQQIVNDKSIMDGFNTNCSIDNAYTAEEAQKVGEMKYLLSKQEIDYVLAKIANEKLVFSHNDIWVGNILLNESNRSVYLIDYERVAFNFPGYDIGKLLLETMYERSDNSPDYKLKEEYFPTESDIIDFLRFYLIAKMITKELIPTLTEDLENISDAHLEKYEKLIYSDNDSYSVKERIDMLLEQVYLGMMVSGYYCAVLGIFLGKAHNVGMDFIQFGIDGHDTYTKYKSYLEEKNSK